MSVGNAKKAMHYCIAVFAALLHNAAMSQLTITEAHRATKKARTTIERHIADGVLSATKNESGRYIIDASELQRVYGNLDTAAIKKAQQKPASLQIAAPETTLEMQQLRHQIELAERERDEAQRREREERQRHDETKAEKARLFNMLEEAQKTIAALPASPTEVQRSKRGIWAWFSQKG